MNRDTAVIWTVAPPAAPVVLAWCDRIAERIALFALRLVGACAVAAIVAGAVLSGVNTGGGIGGNRDAVHSDHGSAEE